MTYEKEITMSCDGEFFTTGEVSKILGIAEKTVRNYCDAGKIRCEKNILTNYRRISKENMVNFMKENSLPDTLIKKVLEKE
jgi:predicted site-specific integrase-resolvase